MVTDGAHSQVLRFIQLLYLCVRKLLRFGDYTANATIVMPIFFPEVMIVTNWGILLGREQYMKLLTDVFSSLLLFHFS
jgi:hypothetical protein